MLVEEEVCFMLEGDNLEKKGSDSCLRTDSPCWQVSQSFLKGDFRSLIVRGKGLPPFKTTWSAPSHLELNIDRTNNISWVFDTNMSWLQSCHQVANFFHLVGVQYLKQLKDVGSDKSVGLERRTSESLVDWSIIVLFDCFPCLYISSSLIKLTCNKISE